MPVGRKAAELLQEVAFIEPHNLPPYNEEGVQLALQETSEHWQLLNKILQEVREASGAGDNGELELERFPRYHCAAELHHDAVLQNKRLLLLYHRLRQQHLEQLRWQSREVYEQLQGTLSPDEQELMKSYDAALLKFNRAVGLDITLDRLPPVDPQIHVTVLEDKGEVMLRSGPVMLTKNSGHYMHRDEAEPLIAAGAVAELMDT